MADTLSRVYSDTPINLDVVDRLRTTHIWEEIRPEHFDLTLDY